MSHFNEELKQVKLHLLLQNEQLMMLKHSFKQKEHVQQLQKPVQGNLKRV